jgi:hypothetical protein
MLPPADIIRSKVMAVGLTRTGDGRQGAHGATVGVDTHPSRRDVPPWSVEASMTTEEAVGAQPQALRLAGFALAQAAWSIEDGIELVPLGIAEQDGQRNAMRFVTDITDARLAELRTIIAGKLEPGRYGVLAFSSHHLDKDREPLAVLNVHILDGSSDLVGTVRQAYQPARSSRIPGRSVPFAVIGTPVPSDEIDIPGSREGILLGVMSHPQGERLFPQLAAFALQMIGAQRSDTEGG